MTRELLLYIFYFYITIMGGVVIYSSQSMKSSGKIKIGWFVGQAIRLEKCRDTQGFIDHIYPKCITFGAEVLIDGILLLLMVLLDISMLIQFVLLLLVIVFYLIFMHHMKKITKEFLM